MITEKDIGRRVIVNGAHTNQFFTNEKGKIIRIHNSNIIGIEFDHKIPGLHTCDGMGKNEQCWYVSEKNITFEKENEKMTGIRIETEKIVEGTGRLSRKITGFKALKKEKLPDMYTKGKRPICFVNRYNDLEINNRAADFKHGFFQAGEIVSEDDFQKLLEHCHKAGDHLKEVNQELAEKQAQWKGTETFII